MRKAPFLLLLLTLLFSTGCDRLGVTLVPDLAVVKVPSGYIQHTNSHSGYSIKHPSELKVDTSFASVRTVLAGSNTIGEIYVQENTSSRSYIRYGNAPILSGRDQVEILKNTDKIVNWRRVRELWWKRPALAEVPDDKPYYASVDIAVGFNKTYTMLFKSSDYAELQRIVPPMVRSFRPIKATTAASISLPVAVERATTLTPEAQMLLQGLKTSDKQIWGLFEPY